MPDFFYDQQLRRYLLQFMRIFSDFKIEYAPDQDGTRVQKVVPIIHGDMRRQAAHVLNQNSPNTTLAAPAMSAYISNFEMMPEQRRDPANISKATVVERAYDKETGEYLGTAGNRYTVERYMPVAYHLTINLDIWTTNQTDKHQILEQILILFNPTMQIQTNANVLDITSITEVELISIDWSSKSVPSGQDLSNDYARLQFKVPVWITPPAKVKRQSLVEQIVASVYDVDSTSLQTRDIFEPLQSAFADLTQFVITPGDYKLEVSAIDATTSKATLLNKFGVADPTITWLSLTTDYGTIDPDTTKLTLKTDNDINVTSGDIVGSLELDANDPSSVILTVDVATIPATIASGAVDAIIDPRNSYPGNGTLPAAAAGQRYLLLDTSNTAGSERIISQDPSGQNPWKGVDAYANDIIEFDGTNWFVSFDASAVTPPLYVQNIDDSQVYKFTTSRQWTYAFLGTYNPGYWRISV